MSQEEHLKAILSQTHSPKPPGASRNAFKPLHHHLPQFKTDGTETEIFHQLDVKNILKDKDKIKIPSKWKSKKDHVRTNTHLARIRKQERIPDTSFDLNGDGTVSPHEYAIAKMFDFDFDDKLSPEEKAYWIKRLKEGFEDGLYWDADQGDQRIIQKDGKILLPHAMFGNGGEGEDEELLGKTLPLLKFQRIQKKKKENDALFEKFLDREQEKKEIIEKMWAIQHVKPSEKKITISEVKENRKNIHRKKAGLSNIPYEEKTIRKDPSMEYIKSPKVYTFSELKEKRVNDKCVDYKFKFDKKSENDEIWTFDNKLLNPIDTLPPK